MRVDLGDNDASPAPRTSAAGEFLVGWKPLAAAAVGLACGIAGVPLYTFGYFVVGLGERYGLSRVEVSGWATAFTLTIILAAPWVGRLTDRYGPRGVAATSFVLLACAYAFAAVAQGGAAVLFATALAIAGAGCGTLPITFTKVVARSFERARGLALGVALCGVLIGVTLTSYILPRVMELHGIAGAYLALTALALIAAPIVFIGLRPASAHVILAACRVESGSTLRQAARRRVFWYMSASFFTFCVASTGIVIHLVPALQERQLAASDTSIYFAVLSAGSIVGRLSIGWLVDRVFAPKVLAPLMALSAGGCLLLNSPAPEATLVAVLLLGFAIGAEVDVISFLAARYFGLLHYGTIYGVLYTIFAAGSAVGPLAVAGIREAGGGYALAFEMCAISMAVSALLFAAMLRHPYDDSVSPL